MDKESIYELQRVDCNCNDCFFMKRNFETYAKWEDWNRRYQQQVFEKKREEAFKIAEACEDEVGKKTLLIMANKMKFHFDKSSLLQYGQCQKFEKQVSFIPMTCQIETQKCFIHRRDVAWKNKFNSFFWNRLFIQDELVYSYLK